MKNVVIAGSEPSGLTLAYLLLQSGNFTITILEPSSKIGGRYRTEDIGANKLDILTQKLFLKEKNTIDFITSFYQIAGLRPKDDVILGRRTRVGLTDISPDNEPCLLYRDNYSNFGEITSVKDKFVNGIMRIAKRNGDNLEDYYTNKYGKVVYEKFYQNYLKKLFGKTASHLPINYALPDESKEFLYPRDGQGQIWEILLQKILELGGKIIYNSKLASIHCNKDIKKTVNAISYIKDEIKYKTPCDIFVSSLAITDMLSHIKGLPDNIKKTVDGLQYRNIVKVGLLVKEIIPQNNSKVRTFNKFIPEADMYVNNPKVNLSKINIYNNYSPYMVENFDNELWLGLEYFCFYKDNIWQSNAKNIVDLAIIELEKIKFLKKEDVISSSVIKQENALCLPAKNIAPIVSFINQFDNLFFIGALGQHKFLDLDGELKTAFNAAQYILDKKSTKKSNIWKTN